MLFLDAVSVSVWESLLDKGLTIFVMAVGIYFVYNYFKSREERYEQRITDLNKEAKEERQRNEATREKMLNQVLESNKYLAQKGDSLNDFTKLMGKIMKEPSKPELNSRIQQILTELNKDKNE